MARKKGKELDSRGALLEAAWQLLGEQGASGMSVDAIVTRAALSKGTFFHFFPAKQDLLDALCARIADESWQQVASVLARSDLHPVARLDLYFQQSRAWQSERTKAIGALWWELVRDENAALMNKVRALGVDRLAPAMASLFVEANNLGAMQVADVEVMARLVIEWISATVTGTLRLIAEKRNAGAIDLGLRRANCTIVALERALGLAQGSLRRVDRRIISKLAADVSGGEDTNAGALVVRGDKKPRGGHVGAPSAAHARGKSGGTRHGNGPRNKRA